MSFLAGAGLFLLRNWKVVLPVIAALALAGYILVLRTSNANLKHDLQTAETQLATAVEINERNKLVIKRMDDNLATERAATQAVTARERKVGAAVKAAESEIQNAPDANAPAGDVFDALGDSLRAIDADRD